MDERTRPLLVMLLCAVLAVPLLAVCSQVHDGDAAAAVDSAVAEDVRDALHDGHAVLLFRHALTDRSVADADPTARGGCDQQRNLSPEGVQQAALIGERLDDLGVEVTAVFASPFCRTVDTAEAMTGRVEATDALLSLTAALDQAGQDRITEAGAALIAQQVAADGVTVMVTHTQNIEALTGRTVEEGEAVVLVDDGTGQPVVLDVVSAADW